MESSRKEEFTKFNGYLNKYLHTDGFTTELLNTCYEEENSIHIDDKVVSLSCRMYDSVDDLAKTFTNTTNRRSYAVSLPAKDNSVFTTQEPVYLYTDIIKPNLVGDLDVTHVINLHFPTK